MLYAALKIIHEQDEEDRPLDSSLRDPADNAGKNWPMTIKNHTLLSIGKEWSDPPYKLRTESIFVQLNKQDLVVNFIESFSIAQVLCIIWRVYT